MGREEILATKNTTETSSCKWDLKKIQARTGFEPMTSTIPVQRHDFLMHTSKGEINFKFLFIQFRFFG